MNNYNFKNNTPVAQAPRHPIGYYPIYINGEAVVVTKYPPVPAIRLGPTVQSTANRHSSSEE